MKIEFLDSGQTAAQCAPNPQFPAGIDVDTARGAAAACLVELPYPAPRCGAYLVECETCGVTVLVTTAGRADDPRSLKLGCRK